MLEFICENCGMTSTFDLLEYLQAIEDGATPLNCDCCDGGSLVLNMKDMEETE